MASLILKGGGRSKRWDCTNRHFAINVATRCTDTRIMMVESSYPFEGSWCCSIDYSAISLHSSSTAASRALRDLFVTMARAISTAPTV
jgi:hypothetical protein